MSDTELPPFSVRFAMRWGGAVTQFYRKETNPVTGSVELKRIGSLSPIATLAAPELLRQAIGGKHGKPVEYGKHYPVDSDWGPRLGCYVFVAAGLRDGERLNKAAGHFLRSDSTEAAWWFGMLLGSRKARVVRALRILVEAVE